MGKLTDKEKHCLIADRVSGMTYRQLAAKYNIASSSVVRLVQNNKAIEQAAAEKRTQNTLDMFAYLESRQKSAQDFIDLALEALKDPNKIGKASLQTLATAMGIIIDKFIDVKPKTEDEGVTIIWGR